MPERVEVSLPSGDILRGDYQSVTGASALVILYVHGFGSHRHGEKAASLAAECARRGLPYAAIDFRGHGETGGPTEALTATRLLEDLSAVRTFLLERGHSRLGVVGSSMGGFAAAWFAVRHPEAVTGCVLIAPAFRFLQRLWDGLTEVEGADWARTRVRRVRNEWVDVRIGYRLVEERAAFDPADLARRWRTPLLLFHGSADDVVPAADALAFVEAAVYPDVELRLFKAGDHRLTAFKDEIAVEACRFFERLTTK